MGNCCSAETPTSQPQDRDAPAPTKQHTVHNVAAGIQQTLDKVPIFHKSYMTKKGNEVKENAMRIKNIFATPIETDEDYKAPVHEKTAEEAKFIQEALQTNFIFGHLNKSELHTLTMAFEKTSNTDGEEVIKQGDIGDYFYITQKGKIKYVVDGKDVGEGGEGTCFGELALLYNCPRAATCKAIGDCVFWKVDQSTFRKILASHQISADNTTKAILKEVPFLADLDGAYLTRINDALTEETFKPGETIFKKGEEGDKFYIIKEGMVDLADIGMGGSRYVDQTIGKGDFFGERALLTGETRAANVKAKTKVVLLAMTRDKFFKVMGPLENVISEGQLKTYLMSIPLFNKSSIKKTEIAELASMMEITKFRRDETIAMEGDVARRSLFIIMNGKVSKRDKNNEIQILGKGDYFGDETLSAGESATVLHKYNIIAMEDTACKELTAGHIKSVFRNVSSILGKDFDHYDDIMDTNLTMDNMKKHCILGAGTFGKVWLVEDKRNGNAYALKIQSKRTILSYSQSEGVCREKNIMANIDNPFVIKLVNAFQDEFNLYMILVMYQGGELFSIIHSNTRDGMPEKEAKFYAAGILEGLSYMHKRKILYRDLKPENVLLGSDGYTVIVDLGFAKVVQDKTYTLCGTPLYLAPEVILQRGHNRGADIWSFGVLVYELIIGTTPFYARDIDQVTLFKRICRCNFKMPSSFTPEASDMISSILKTRLSERMGLQADGDDEIRDCAWFKNSIDWRKMKKKEIEAPWVPKVKNPLDSTNFDDWSHLEEEDRNQKKEKPLSKKEQNAFSQF